jgi:hypothetical protein
LEKSKRAFTTYLNYDLSQVFATSFTPKHFKLILK